MKAIEDYRIHSEMFKMQKPSEELEWSKHMMYESAWGHTVLRYIYI